MTTLGPTTLVLQKLDTTSLETALGALDVVLANGAFDGEGPYCAAAAEAAQRAADLLVKEKRLGTGGCLYSNRCDASPPRTVRDAMTRLAAITGHDEPARERCTRVFGNDLKGPTVPPATALANLVAFESNLNTTLAILKEQWDKAPHDSTWGASALGARRSGKSSGGNSQFGAGYDYAADWAIEPLEYKDGAACKLAGHAGRQPARLGEAVRPLHRGGLRQPGGRYAAAQRRRHHPPEPPRRPPHRARRRAPELPRRYAPLR